jgi:hypothetical protein
MSDVFVTCPHSGAQFQWAARVRGSAGGAGGSRVLQPRSYPQPKWVQLPCGDNHARIPDPSECNPPCWDNHARVPNPSECNPPCGDNLRPALRPAMQSSPAVILSQLAWVHEAADFSSVIDGFNLKSRLLLADGVTKFVTGFWFYVPWGFNTALNDCFFKL